MIDVGMAETVPEILRHGSGHLQSMFAALGDNRHHIEKIAKIEKIKAGTVLSSDGSATDKIGYIIDGTLAMTKVLPNGHSQILGLLVPTDMFGRVFEDVPLYSITALTDAVIYSMLREPFEAILEQNPEVERLFLINVLDELDAAREWILLLGGYKVIERVASFLLILCRRRIRTSDRRPLKQNAPILLHVGIKRSSLAQYLGTRVESVSRAFHELQARKSIRIIDAYTFEIVDVDSLVEIASHDMIRDV